MPEKDKLTDTLSPPLSSVIAALGGLVAVPEAGNAQSASETLAQSKLGQTVLAEDFL